jgi:hypothetical protein
MNLVKAAGYFDKTPVYDAYTGRFLFMGQTAPWDGKERDSVITQRRVLSVKGSVVAPPRRVVRILDENYIIGGTQDDTFKGRIIRRGLIIQQVQDQAVVQTIEQSTLGQIGKSIFVAVDWRKYSRYASESSDMVPDFDFYFASTESVPMNSLLTHNGEYYLTRETTMGQAGMLVVFVHRLMGSVFDTASAPTGTYDPITETTSGAVVTFPVIRLRWECVFQYLSASAPTFQPGDIQVAVNVASHVVKEGIRLTMSDGEWLIHSVITQGTIQFCRCTKHV